MKIINFIVVALILAVLSACTLTPTNKADSAVTKTKNIPPISVQLWSVKDQLKSDFKGTLVKISKLGFDGVEFAGDFGTYGEDAEGLKKYLDSLGLKVSAAHTNFDAFNDENFEKSVSFYKTLGVDTLIVAWDVRAWDENKVDALISDLMSLYTKLSAEGFRFGFHNHDKEFGDFKNTTFWDHIATSTPHDFILQMDVGWVTYAQKDPVKYIKRYAGRTLTTHIKAKLPEGIHLTGKRPIIGEDTTDWASVLKTEMAVGGTKWFVLEQEEYPDGLTPMQAVALSKQGLDKIIAAL